MTLLKLKRKGLNFYALRHTFETIAGDSRDQIAVDFIMGHPPAANDMAAVYRRRLNDSRLLEVVEFVRRWLWPEGSETASLAADIERNKAKEAAAQDAEKSEPRREGEATSKPVPVENL